MTIPTQIPASLTAGDTWRFTLDLADYPAPTWDATVYLTNADGVVSSTASDDGTSHAFSIAAATTAGYRPGRYTWIVRVTDGTIVETALDGAVQVLPNPITKNDTRSWARRTLEAVECFLAGNASTAQASMTIRDRSISRWSIAELMQWRDKLRAECRAEEQGANAGLGRNIKVRFSRG